MDVSISKPSGLLKSLKSPFKHPQKSPQTRKLTLKPLSSPQTHTLKQVLFAIIFSGASKFLRKNDSKACFWYCLVTDFTLKATDCKLARFLIFVPILKRVRYDIASLCFTRNFVYIGTQLFNKKMYSLEGVPFESVI